MKNQTVKINIGLAVVIVLCSLEYIEGNKLLNLKNTMNFNLFRECCKNFPSDKN